VDTQDILKSLNEIFRDVLDDDDISLELTMVAADVPGWDSLAHVRLMLATQRRFGLRFSAAEIGSLKNIGDLAALVARKSISN
jgi:acyl carrier protein